MKTRLPETIVLVLLALLAAAWAQAAPYSLPVPRELLPFETVSHPIQLNSQDAPTLRELGFERIIVLIENNQLVEGIHDAYLMGIRAPALWDLPEYQLLIAELYFRLGINDPAVQYRMAKPILERLMRRYPLDENQPLVAFRLATIYDRQGFASEAIAHYGLLVDWYPNDPLADKAQLGLVMVSLRENLLEDTESQAKEVLAKSKDAQVRFHAALCLGIARHRLGRDAEAVADFRSVVKWPEDRSLLVEFELFAYAETMYATSDFNLAGDAALAYLQDYPLGEDRPLAVFYLAEIARTQQNYGDAVIGYRYLISQYRDHPAGLHAELELAKIRLQAFPDSADPITEKLLLTVYNQNASPDLSQEAALLLAEYYLRTGEPLTTIVLGAGIYDSPLNLGNATRAVEHILKAFAQFVAGNTDNPMLVAQVFNQYRKYLALSALPPATYDQLAQLFYENLQPDTLLELATKTPLADRYPRQSAFYAALAEYLRNDLAAAQKYLDKLAGLPSPAGAGKKKSGPDPLRYEGRVLSAQIEKDLDRPKQALEQLVLARVDASDTIEEGRLEMMAGSLLLARNEPQAAADRLTSALKLLGPVTEAQPVREWQDQALFALGDALYRTQRNGDAKNAFQALLERPARPYWLSLARWRLAQILLSDGTSILPGPDAKPETTPPADFWPAAAWNLNRHLQWLEVNEKRFGDEPAWETLP